jgi:hypothetical protein
MPAFRSVVSVLSREPRETLLDTLKAGPTVTGDRPHRILKSIPPTFTL